MPVYEMSCPKCGKRAAEYAEDKWQCLSCQHKFIYKDESVVQNTTVNVASAPLVDLEPANPSDERPLYEPYLKRHPFLADKEINKLTTLKQVVFAIMLTFCMLAGLVSLVARAADSDSWWIGLIVICIILFIYIIARGIFGWKIEKRRAVLATQTEVVGWTTLCPCCKAGYASYYFAVVPPPASPVHCAACGKQFMLLKGHSFNFKREPTRQQPPPPLPMMPMIATGSAPSFIACPSCGIGLPLASIARGKNNCPSCKKEYVAE